MQTDEIESRHLRYSAIMFRLPILSQDRKVNPREAGIIARAPDQVLHVQQTIVREQWAPVSHSNDLRNALDSGGDQICWLDSDKWSRMGKHFGTHLSTNRRTDGQQVMSDESNQAYKNEPSHKTLDLIWHMTGFLSRHPRPVTACDLYTDIRSRVSRSDNENSAFLQLRWIPVIVCMQLNDPRIQTPRENGYPWILIIRHGHDDVFRLEPATACRYNETVAILRQFVHLDVVQNRQPKMLGVRLKVVRHLVFRRKRIATSWEPHSRKSGISSRCE